MNSTQRILLISERHRRFEYGRMTSDDNAYRTIDLILDNNSLIISINPTLTPKPAIMIRVADGYTIYKGIDPDYEFHLSFNGNTIINEIRLFRLDKGLELRYDTRLQEKD